MYEKYYIPREIPWCSESGKDFEHTKKEILNILKEQKVSLSEIRSLFHSIINEIEDKNPINL